MGSWSEILVIWPRLAATYMLTALAKSIAPLTTLAITIGLRRQAAVADCVVYSGIVATSSTLSCSIALSETICPLICMILIGCSEASMKTSRLSPVEMIRWSYVSQTCLTSALPAILISYSTKLSLVDYSWEDVVATFETPNTYSLPSLVLATMICAFRLGANFVTLRKSVIS